MFYADMVGTLAFMMPYSAAARSMSPRGSFMRPWSRAIAITGLLTLHSFPAWAQRGDECWDRISSIYADMIQQGFSLDGARLEQSGCSAFNLKFRQMSEHCDFNLYLQYAQEMLRQQEARFRQCQSIRQDWCTEQLMTDHKSFEKRQSSYATINRWRTQCRNVDR
jgi:hypothetical protein